MPGLCCSSVVVSGAWGCSPIVAWGFLLQCLLWVQTAGSRALGPQLWLGSGAGSRVVSMGLLLLSLWDLPGPGMEPVSPALAGGFFTPEPPGKPEIVSFNFVA